MKHERHDCAGTCHAWIGTVETEHGLHQQLVNHTSMPILMSASQHCWQESTGTARGYGATLKTEGDNDDEFGFFTLVRL